MTAESDDLLARLYASCPICGFIDVDRHQGANLIRTQAARIERLERELENLENLPDTVAYNHIKAQARRLLANDARYRWLKDNTMWIHCASDDSSAGNFQLGEDDNDMAKLDAAIDSAQRKGE